MITFHQVSCLSREKSGIDSPAGFKTGRSKKIPSGGGAGYRPDCFDAGSEGHHLPTLSYFGAISGLVTGC